MFEIIIKCIFRYLNNTKRKQYASRSKHQIDPAEPKQMRVGELGFDIWKRIIIVPLNGSMSKLLLDDFDKPRYNLPITTPLDTIAVILKSFVEVQELKKKCTLEVSIYF